MNPTATFGSTWDVQVKNLIAKNGGLLNVRNGEWKSRFTGKNAKFAKQEGEFRKLAAELVESLLNDNVSAEVARDLLGALRQLITKPGAQYSNFPSQINNCLLEYINAKALWRAQIVWPLPGPGIDGAGKEPDYTVAGFGIDGACGDHIRAQAPRDAQAMIAAIADALNEKLNTYEQPQVRVVIDTSESCATADIGNRPQDRQAWAGLVAEAVKDVRQVARLYELDIVVAPTVVLQFLNGTDY
jgi:hypothetical protein